MFFNWFAISRPRTPRPPRRTSVKVRPRLEALEGRLAPATRIWDGGATASNNWTNANNWQGNVAPVAGDDLVFPANVSDKTADNNFAAGTLFNSITLGGGYTLRGARILLGAGGIIDNSGTSNQINNDVDLGQASTTPRTFAVGTGSTLFIDGEITGFKELRKTGTGNLSFRRNNSYSGFTDVQAGILFIEKDESLGSHAASSGTLVRGGATLLVNDNAIGAIRTDELITVADGGTIRALNDVELRGNLSTLGTATLKHEGTFFFDRLLVSGQISGSGGITIALASGQVKFQGSQSNTYQGTTLVSGKLRLDNSAGNAVPGNVTVNGSGRLRLDHDHQIADGADVTVLGGGVFMTNEHDDTFHKLKLVGGLVDGNQLDLLNFAQRTAKLREFLDIDPLTPSELRPAIFEATSSSATLPAKILDVTIQLIGNPTFIQVNDGPAFNDFVVQGPILGVGLTLLGSGTTLIQDLAPSFYDVNGGLLRINRFERLGHVFDYANLGITVNAGGKFAGDATIFSLEVHAGGRVRPGPLSSTGKLGISHALTLHPGSVLEVTLNGSVAGTGHDQLDVDGVIGDFVTIFPGAILEPTMGPNAAVGQNYRIINNAESDPIAGEFFVPPETAPFLAAPPTGQRLLLNYAGGFLNNDLVLTLVDTPPMAPDLAIDKTVLDEGRTVTVTGHLVDPDPGARLRLRVNWGDGSRPEIFRPGLADFALRHRYRQDGQYVARFEWLDQHGEGNSREFHVTVNNVPPQLLLGTPRITPGRNLVLGGFVRDPGADRLTLTVDFGDGTPVHTRTLANGRTFLLRHRFARSGTYLLTATLTDGNGGVTTAEHVITV